MTFSDPEQIKAAPAKAAADVTGSKSVPAVTDDVILGQGVVVAVLNDKFGLIFGPQSAGSDDAR